MMDSLPGSNTDSNNQGVKVTCVVKEDKNYEEVFTIPEKQAKAIFMTVNGKLPSELTFKWWNDEDQSEKFYDDTRWSTMRHLIVQQTLFNFYMIHKSFLQEQQDKTNTSLDKVNLWLMGQTDEEPKIISSGWGIFNIYLTRIVCGFMFTVPFMQFVGAHCNTNVTCIYYRMPIKVDYLIYDWEKHDMRAKIFRNWILKILVFLGDNGKYNWIVNLDKQADCGGSLKINQSILDYMNHNTKFAVFLHALQNKDEFENVATMTFKRKRPVDD